MKRRWRQWRLYTLCIALVIVAFIIACEIRPPCLWPYLLLQRYPKLTADDNIDVTLVTAYFNLENYTQPEKTFNFHKYLRWAGVFKYVMNPLVVFTDSEQLYDMLKEARLQQANKMRVVLVRREELKAFRDKKKVHAIFQDPRYPRHFPNTVIAEYPCTQHAKYELVLETMDKQYFSNTKYIAWIDIGYFRYLTERRRNFYLVAPPGVDDSKIAMTEIHRPNWSLIPKDIFYGNLVWVGGGMSLGTRPVFRRFVEDYATATEIFLKQGLSSTDQQVLYAMFSSEYRKANNIQISIQTYSWDLEDIKNCWFYLGYLCYREVD